MSVIKRCIVMISLLILAQEIHAQWNKIYQFDVEMHDIWFINKDTGFICGATEHPVLMRTHDGGYTWDDITSNITDPVYAVNFLNESKGFIATWGYSSKEVWATLDAGQTWLSKYSTTPYINVIAFPTAQVGYTFASAMEYVTVVKTTDGGATWNQVAFLTTPAAGLGVPDAQFLTNSLGYMVTDEGSVYKTTNGGVDWTSKYHSNIYSMTGVCFLDQNYGFATGMTSEYGYHEGLLLKTTNGGSSWDDTYFDTPFYDVWFPYPDTGFISTYGVLKSKDAGNTWFSDTCNYITSLRKLRFGNQEIGYGLSHYPGMTVLMKRDPDIGVRVHEISDPIRFEVYPVPTLNQINIRFNLVTGGRVVADLVNGYGVNVKTMTDAVLPEGDHTIAAGISSLAPGIYYVRIQTLQSTGVKKVIIPGKR